MRVGSTKSRDQHPLIGVDRNPYLVEIVESGAAAQISVLHELQASTYGLLKPIYPNVIAFMGRTVMENVANSMRPITTPSTR